VQAEEDIAHQNAAHDGMSGTDMEGDEDSEW